MPLLRTFPCLLLAVLCAQAVAQDELPPPPPPADVKLIRTRPIAWTRYAAPDGAFEVQLINDSLARSERIWHLGRTSFVTTEGVLPWTTVEYTRLFPALASLDLDSLVRAYWPPGAGEWSPFTHIRDTTFQGLPAALAERPGGSGPTWVRALFVRPDKAELIACLSPASAHDAHEEAIIAQFFGSLTINKKHRPVQENVVAIAPGTYFVNDTLGYSIALPFQASVRNSLVQGDIAMSAWTSSDAFGTPAIYIITTRATGAGPYPQMTLDNMAWSMIKQGFDRRQDTVIDHQPTAVFVKLDPPTGDRWTCHLIAAPGHTFHAVMVRTHDYWSDAFEQEVLSSIRIRAGK